MTKTKIYIVRAEDGGAPESLIAGVYPTLELAMAREVALDGDFEFIWTDIIEVGPDGADCMIQNR